MDGCSKKIEGINIGRVETKIALYAGDIVCYLRNLVRSIKGLLELIGHLESCRI